MPHIGTVGLLELKRVWGEGKITPERGGEKQISNGLLFNGKNAERGQNPSIAA
jgi:hypothetical protein